MRCPEENAAEDVAQYHLGGMILFGRDFKGKTYAQVRALTEELQQSADIPLLIGADEEGGTVVRASVNPSSARRQVSRAPGAVRCRGSVRSARRCGGKVVLPAGAGRQRQLCPGVRRFHRPRGLYLSPHAGRAGGGDGGICVRCGGRNEPCRHWRRAEAFSGLWE